MHSGKIYLILTPITIIILALNGPVKDVIIHAIWVIFWIWLLQYLCSNGYNTISWILVSFSAFFSILIGIGLAVVFIINPQPPTN